MHIHKVLSLAFLAGAGLQAVAGQPPEHTILIEEGGRAREFVAATNEMATINENGQTRFLPIAGAQGLEAIVAQAQAHTKSTSKEAEVVLYEKGTLRTDSNRRILTKNILVEVQPAVDIQGLAAALGADYEGPAPSGENLHILRSRQAGGALKLTQALRTQPGVISASPLLGRRASKRSALPNDPYFSSQWHLKNTGQNGGLANIDVNVVNVWSTYQGTGVRIGVVDDSVEIYHPDLRPNIDFQNSYDFVGNDRDPSPDFFEDGWQGDYHGTPVAGLVAARGNNGFGVSGVAPRARIVGMRLTSGFSTDLQESDAFSYRNDIIQIKTNSWGPDDDGLRLEGPGVLAAKAFQESATLGRGGKGTIFVWAGGNGRLDGDNSNYDGYANSIHTIAVGAVDDRGRVSDYSEPGANLVVVAPSDTGWYTSFRQGIATTDLVGDQGLNAEGLVNDVATVYGYPSDFPNASYTKIMGGTSSATPIAAGVIALILEANPQLGWRDVQAILIKTATKVSPSHRDWIVNGAGQPFNHDFGAGLINAEAAVTLAKTWKLLPKQQSIVREETALSLRIPDNQAAGLTRSYAVSSNLRVEHVTVTVDLQHENRGQLEVLLTSPSGTVSRLAEVHQDDGDDYKWTFMTVRNWGESAQGTWRLTVRDRVSGTVGTLKSVRLTVLGSSL